MTRERETVPAPPPKGFCSVYDSDDRGKPSPVAMVEERHSDLGTPLLLGKGAR